jgi:tight adherence protein C
VLVVVQPAHADARPAAGVPVTDTRVILVAGLLVWAGASVMLSGWSRLARPSLADRLRPYHAGVGASPDRTPQAGLALGPAESQAGQWAKAAGDRMAALLGVTEGADRRLRRVHSGIPAAVFRVRQMAAAAVASVALAVVSVLTGASPALALFLVAGSGLLVFLLIEQHLTARSDRWKRTTEAEIPVVAEQLAMLLNSGSSLGAALHRLAARGKGCVVRDLEIVVNRLQQGLSEREALNEWSEAVDVEAVARLVSVLTTHREAADVGRLVSAEARRARRDLQRRTIEQLERRGQQVWVPVTVATLVPGAIFLAVPFLAALQLFGGV